MMAAPPGAAGGGGGAGGGPPAEPVKPPTEAPDALQPFLDLLTKPLALILVAKQIPWVVQAKLAQEGYVTVEDLGTGGTPRRRQGPKGPGTWSSRLGRTTPPGSLPCAFCRWLERPSQWLRHSFMLAARRPRNPQARPRALCTASAIGGSWRPPMLRPTTA